VSYRRVRGGRLSESRRVLAQSRSGKATLPNLRTRWAGKTASAQTVAAGFVGATTMYIDSALVGRGADGQHRSARDAAVRDPLSRSQERIDSE
jgi:hypothetical protein